MEMHNCFCVLVAICIRSPAVELQCLPSTLFVIVRPAVRSRKRLYDVSYRLCPEAADMQEPGWRAAKVYMKRSGLAR